MINKRLVLAIAVLFVVALFVAALPTAQAAGDRKIVVRVFLDNENDFNDKGNDVGLEGWTVTLSGVTPKIVKTTGPEGFASFTGLDATKTYTIRIDAPSEGWRLARGPWGAGAYGKPHTRFVVGGVYTLAPNAPEWLPRVTGNTEAWVRFSTIRVQRIIVSGAIQGDTYNFYRVQPNGSLFLVDTDVAGPNGFATAKAGGMFYGNEIVVKSMMTGAQTKVKIPFGYQPKVKFISPNTLVCTSHCGY